MIAFAKVEGREAVWDSDALSDQPTSVRDVDMLIVGAGISGIDAAYHLQTSCPDHSFALFEGRERIGGTWDLFRYPGIRSDSDMHTFGFPFFPWRGAASIAAGADIRDYIEDTARHFGIDRAISYRHRVTGAAWSSTQARWTVDYEVDGVPGQICCRFLYMGSGYYDYAKGHAPQIAQADSFGGQWVHPQHWPQDLVCAGKRITVIGSGATAVTLIPALVERGAQVTMLQRSPSYIVSRPASDPLARKAHRWLPRALAGAVLRWKNVAYGLMAYRLARKDPERMRALVMKGTRHYLPNLPDVERHFTPRYEPWDQRLCLVPDGDLFKVLNSGAATIVTDGIDHATPTGLTLTSGKEIAADIIVTATGLSLQLFGGMAITVDGVRVDPAHRKIYRGMMLDQVPNFVMAFGYTNASWTLKVDLVARRLCRMLNHMRRHGLDICNVGAPGPGIELRPMLDFSSGYVQRAEAILPQQGSASPWRVRQNYLLDLIAFRFSRLADGVLTFRERMR